jgi:DNA-binding NarL/FixJ family response regulator
MAEVFLPLMDARVLLIEDEPLVAMMLEEFVNELGGVDCITASHAGAALSAIEHDDIDIAIVDVSLTSDGPSFEIADALADKGIDFIFSTGRTASDLPPRHCDVPFLSKPYSLDDLSRAIAVYTPKIRVT